MNRKYHWTRWALTVVNKCWPILVVEHIKLLNVELDNELGHLLIEQMSYLWID